MKNVRSYTAYYGVYIHICELQPTDVSFSPTTLARDAKAYGAPRKMRALIGRNMFHHTLALLQAEAWSLRSELDSSTVGRAIDGFQTYNNDDAFR